MKLKKTDQEAAKEGGKLLHKVEAYIMATEVNADLDSIDEVLEQLQAYIQMLKNFLELGKGKGSDGKGKKRKPDE
eukprot:3740573-Amphidinium_carterae.1